METLIATWKRFEEWYGGWYYASAIQLVNQGWKNLLTIIYPTRRSEPKIEAVVWDYKWVQLGKGILTFEETQQLLRQLASNQVLQFPGLPRLDMVAYLYPENPPTRFGSSSPISPIEYPFLRYQFSVLDEYVSRSSYGLVYSPDLPLYPNTSEAVYDFCGLPRVGRGDLNGQFYLLVPDYRARIRTVTLSSTSIKIECDLNTTKSSELIGKAYFEGPQGIKHADFQAGNQIEIAVPSFPSRFVVSLLSTEGELIDVNEYSAGAALPQVGIELETTLADLEQIVLAGESETLEFKRELSRDKKWDLAVSVVAMANRKGGRILLGVNDSAEIVGFAGEKAEETVRNILREYCDPPLEPKVEAVGWKDKVVLAIIVTEGGDKPYSVKGKGIYVRTGSTDRIATRYEIDEMYKQKGRPLGFMSM